MCHFHWTTISFESSQGFLCKDILSSISILCIPASKYKDKVDKDYKYWSVDCWHLHERVAVSCGYKSEIEYWGYIIGVVECWRSFEEK